MTSTLLTRVKGTLALVAIAAMTILTAPALAHAGTVSDGRSPDTLDAGSAVHPATLAPDWLERYASAHPYGEGTPFAGTVSDGRSPDTLDAGSAVHPATLAPDWLERYANAHPYGEGTPFAGTVSDGRSPDTLDAASAVRHTDLLPTARFDWADAGIGAAFGAGAMIAFISGIAVLLVVRRQHEARTV